MTSKEYLKSLGLSYENIILTLDNVNSIIDQTTKARHINEVDLADRIKHLSVILGTTEKNIAQLVVKKPMLLRYNVAEQETRIYIKDKIVDLSKILNLDKEQTLKLISTYPQILMHHIKSDMPSSVKNKINSYAQILKLPRETICRMIYKNPNLIALNVDSDSPTSVKTKVELYKQLLDTEDIGSIILGNPTLLFFDLNADSPSSVQQKIKDLQQITHLSDRDVLKTIRRFPRVLGMDMKSNSTKSLKNKFRTIAKMFNISEEECSRVVLKSPQLLGHDLDTLGLKYEKLKTMLPTKDIVEKPFLFVVPTDSLERRYKILKPIADQQLDKNDVKLVIAGKHLLLHESVLWARKQFLLEKGLIKSLKRIAHTKNDFYKLFNIYDEELVKRYPLTRDNINQINAEYVKLYGCEQISNQTERE